MNEFLRSVEVLRSDGSRAPSQVAVQLSNEGSPRHYEVAIELSGSRYTGQSTQGIFFALQDLRRKLEPIDVWLDCFGAREDIYPTHMMQSMGPSLVAVRHIMGEQTKMDDIVDIFDTDGLGTPATVEAQEAYRRSWMESLKKKSAEKRSE